MKGAILGRLSSWLLRGLGATWRIRTEGPDPGPPAGAEADAGTARTTGPPTSDGGGRGTQGSAGLPPVDASGHHVQVRRPLHVYA